MSELSDVRTQACRDDDLRMSGLQLPGEISTNHSLDPACSLSVCQTATYRWSLAEDLIQYAEAGIGGIALYRPKVEELEEELSIDLIRSTSLAVSSLSWVGGLTGSDGRCQDEAIFDAVEALRFAAAIKAGTTVVVSGGSGRHILKHARRLLTDGLRRLSDEAADVGQRLALHPFSSEESRSRTVVTSLAETLDAVLATNRENVGILFDTHELRREPSLLELIPQVIPFVHGVRLSERRARNERCGRHADCGATELVNTFVDAGYTGPFEFGLLPNTEMLPVEYGSFLGDCRSRFEVLGPLTGSSS